MPEAKLEIKFENWRNEKINKENFQWDPIDQPLVDFYNRFAKKFTKGRISTIKNIFDQNGKMIGYYAVAMSSTESSTLFDSKRDSSFPHPTLMLGRVLLCKTCRDRKIGTRVIDHVVMLAQNLNRFAACRFIAVDSKPHVQGFYKKMGFEAVEPKPKNFLGKTIFFLTSIPRKIFVLISKKSESTVTMLFDLKV